jgi:hypothetical protein
MHACQCRASKTPRRTSGPPSGETWRQGFHHPQALSVMLEHGRSGPTRHRAFGRGPGALHAQVFGASTTPGVTDQGPANHSLVAEKQFGQRPCAQSFERLPGASQGALTGGAAGPHHGLVVHPEQDLPHMATDLLERQSFGAGESLRALREHLHPHRTMLTQPGGQRSGGMKPLAQGGSCGVHRPAGAGGMWMGAL